MRTVIWRQATAGAVQPFRQTRSAQLREAAEKSTASPVRSACRGLAQPAADRRHEARLAPVADGRRQRRLGHVGHRVLGVDARQHVAGRQGGEEERIDVGHADLHAVRHAGPVGVAQQLVAHVERRLERGHAIEVAERPAGLQRGRDVAERRQAAQAVGNQRRIEQLVELPRHVDAAAQQIGAGPVAAVLQHARRLGMQAETGVDRGRQHAPRPARRGPGTNDTGAASARCAARRRTTDSRRSIRRRRARSARP